MIPLAIFGDIVTTTMLSISLNTAGYNKEKRYFYDIQETVGKKDFWRVARKFSILNEDDECYNIENL